MNFNFLINNNEVIIDPKCQVVLFGNDYVNQIEFKLDCRKESSKNNYIYYNIKKRDYLFYKFKFI